MCKRMIDSDTIKAIGEANDIVKIIGQSLKLERSGNNYKGLCPFHESEDRAATFYVSSQRQVFHCFDCGAGGSVFRWVMMHDDLDFEAATRKLADRAGIALWKARPTALG